MSASLPDVHSERHGNEESSHLSTKLAIIPGFFSRTSFRMTLSGVFTDILKRIFKE